MKKNALLAALVCALALTACGGGGSNDDKIQTATEATTKVIATTTPEQAIALFGTPSQNRGVEPLSDGGTLQVIQWSMPDGTLLQLTYKNGKLWQLITSDATPDHNRTGFIQF
jgi:hypothetical protein